MSSPDPGRMADLWQVNKYLWLCLLVAALYIPVARDQGLLSVSVPAAYGILFLAVANGGLRTWSGWRQGGYNGPRGWIFTVTDVILVAVGIHVTGQLRSELWLVFYVILISESLYALPGQTSVLMSLITAAYAAATWSSRAEPAWLQIVATRLVLLLIVGSFARRLSMAREHRNQELAQLSAQVAASEERARIAREVHDGLGHALVASILRLELCRRIIRKNPGEAEAILEEEVPALRAAWNEGRDLAFHLRPWEPDPAGFSATVRRHVSRFAERTGIAVDLEVAEVRLPQDTQMALTRILQEALTNVAKHAGAARATVRIVPAGSWVAACIEDDGRGFDPAACDGSFGLHAMRQRAEKLGGRMVVESAPDRGTRIRVELPAS